MLSSLQRTSEDCNNDGEVPQKRRIPLSVRKQMELINKEREFIRVSIVEFFSLIPLCSS